MFVLEIKNEIVFVLEILKWNFVCIRDLKWNVCLRLDEIFKMK